MPGASPCARPPSCRKGRNMDSSGNSSTPRPVDLEASARELEAHEPARSPAEQSQSMAPTLRPGGITSEVMWAPGQEKNPIVRVRLEPGHVAALNQTIEQTRRIIPSFVMSVNQGLHQVVQDVHRMFEPLRQGLVATIQANQHQIRAVTTLVEANAQYMRSVGEQFVRVQQAFTSAVSPEWLRVSVALREVASAAARLQLDPRFLELLSWWEKRQRIRANAPFPWGELYAVEDALMNGDGRRLLDFTRDVLKLKPEDVGYVYESLREDGWETSRSPIPYLRLAVRRRRDRAEDAGSRDWLLLESGLVVESDGDPVGPLVNAEAPQGLDPALRVDLMRAGQELKLSPDALALHITLAEGGTEGDMLLLDGWDRRRLDRAKKQRQRALAKVRTRWVN